MPARPTIADVARASGVSTATVDRVLNGRESVREETRRRVAEAAHRVGYHAAALIEHRARAELPEVSLGFLLHKESQAFYQAFGAQARRACREAENVRAHCHLHYAASQAPSEVARLMREMGEQVDALAATAVNHPDILQATEELRARGVPVFSLLSDFAQGVRAQYVGMNNLKVGRTAAWMLATAMQRPGKIALFVGGHRWHGHELRETGFRSFFREHPVQFEVLDTLINLETRQLTYEATLDLLSRHRDLQGMYLAGGGMEGAFMALRETRQPGEVRLVVNELTPHSRSAMLDDYVTMVIETPLTRLCDDLVGLMVDAVNGVEQSAPGQHFLPPVIHLPETV